MRTPEEIQAEIVSSKSLLESHVYYTGWHQKQIAKLTAELEAAEAATPKPWPQVGDMVYTIQFDTVGTIVMIPSIWNGAIASGRGHIFQTPEARDEALDKVKAFLANGCVDPQVKAFADEVRHLPFDERFLDVVMSTCDKYDPPQEVKA